MHDWRWCTRRRDDAEGGDDIERKPGLGESGDTGKLRRRLRQREHPELARLDVRERGGDVREHERDLTAEQILVARADALVGNMDEARARVLFEHAHAEEGRAAGAGGT